MNLIAIDPGVYQCACAAFESGRLVRVWFQTPDERSRPFPLDRVIVEQPQVDARTRTSVNSVVALAWSGAIVAGRLAGERPIVAVTPSAWKGSEPKPQQHARLWEILDAGERALLGGERTLAAILAARRKGALNRWAKPGASYYPRSFETHNALDAVALGCCYVDRLEKR